MIRTLDARALGLDAVVTALARPPSGIPVGVAAAVDEILAAGAARARAIARETLREARERMGFLPRPVRVTSDR